jgi:hypothetical protein
MALTYTVIQYLYEIWHCALFWEGGLLAYATKRMPALQQEEEEEEGLTIFLTLIPLSLSFSSAGPNTVNSLRPSSYTVIMLARFPQR